MEVVHLLRMCLCTGRMAELNIRELSCCLNDIILVAKTVRKYEIASRICKFTCRLVALLSLRNTGLEYVLNSHLIARLFCCVDEIQVISRIFVMQENKSGFDCILLCVCCEAGKCPQGNHRCCCKDQFRTLFHVFSPFLDVIPI